MYKVVGQQRSAVRLALNQGQTAVLNAPILTINSEKALLSNSTLNGPADLSISTGPDPVVFDPRDWTVRSQFVAATIGNQNIISAPGGVFRVDVPKGDRFILTPSQLVAYKGIRPINVYENGRLDVIKAWGSWIREGFRSIFIGITRATKYIFTKGSKLLGSSQPASVTNEVPSWYSKDPTYTVYWHKVKLSSQGVWGAVRDWAFHATHPKKLQFDGPCSILIRGRI